MYHTQNSPIHRIGMLLYGDSGGRAQTVNCSSGYPPCPPSLEPLGERVTSARFASMTSGYGYCADPFPMYNLRHYPATDNEFAGAHALTPIPQSFDTSPNPGGVFSEPVDAYQPPMPPAAPDQSIPLNPAFHYYSCRWLSGPQCDGLAPGRNREMGEHLRVFHRFIGHERDTVQCEWENCGQVMQRMNVPRHIVSRHLLAAANCRFCGKRFSRPDVVARHERTCSGSPVSTSSVARV